MALLSDDMIRHIRGVTNAYSARERERLGASESRRAQPSPRRSGPPSPDSAR